MKILKRTLKFLLFLIILLVVLAIVYVQFAKPDYEGEIAVSDLQDPVEVYYDTHGIPHIFGADEVDAMFALGYVHAQDRLWQMELLRRIGSGRLSEIFGERTLDTDKFFLNLGIDEASAKAVAKLDRESPAVMLAEAYLRGVNTFIEEGPTPVEYHLTGLDKTPFTLTDVYNTIGSMAFSFASAHRTDPLLTEIHNRLGAPYIEDLLVSPYSERIPSYDKRNELDSLNLKGDLLSMLDDLPVPLFEGSNSWVLAPDHTRNGAVILANDPHIQYAQPTTWYEAHMKVPGHEIYGYHLAGVPFPLLGHGREKAYGLTMLQNDDLDFILLEGNPWDSERKTIKKEIKIKGTDPVQFEYQLSSYGPVVNSVLPSIKSTSDVAMRWSYTQKENLLLDALYGLSHATEIDAFEAAVKKIHAPGLNVMYGDKKGNIAWWAAAHIYRLADSLSGKFLLQTTQTADSLFLEEPFKHNPKAINPPWNYVYSANNQPDSVHGILFPGYYLPQDRALRIDELLAGKSDWDLEATQQMITDNVSATAPEIITAMASQLDLRALDDQTLGYLDLLDSWDGDHRLDSRAATLYHRWMYFYFENVFKDELGADAFQRFLSTKLHKKVLPELVANKTSIWYDNVNTDTVETAGMMIQKSILEALESLRQDFGEDDKAWEWRNVHSLELNHAFGSVSYLRKLFNVGPKPAAGGREVINNLNFNYDSTGYFPVRSGPSTRRVIDFSDIENSLSILPSGQSGNPFSKYYEDQYEDYLKGKFRKMQMNKDSIVQKSESLLIFNPVAH